MHTPRFEGSPTRIDKFGGKVRRIAVEGMLAAASSEMAKRIGARVDVSWDYDAWGNVKPDFRAMTRIEHMHRSDNSGPPYVDQIKELWEHACGENPDVVRFDNWITQQTKSTDTRPLTNDEFAERMRLKREHAKQVER
jgi:hypothetical protein